MGLQKLIYFIPHTSSIFLGLVMSFTLSAFAQQEMTQPLQGLIGQADRGRALVSNKQKSLCLLCHQGPIPEDRFQGNLAPDLGLIAQRLTAAQLRARGGRRRPRGRRRRHPAPLQPRQAHGAVRAARLCVGRRVPRPRRRQARQAR